MQKFTYTKLPADLRQKIINGVNKERLVKLCSDLIKFDSVVERDAAEVEIAAYVTAFLKRINYEVKVTDLPEDIHIQIPGLAKGPHPQVLARRNGSGGGPVLCVGGHLDTEPVVNPEQWQHDPFSGDIADGYIYGVGTVNMKQSLASFLETLEVLHELNLDFKGDLMFAGWSQENNGLIGSKYMAHNWDKVGLGSLPDMIFDGEQTDCAIWSTNMNMGVFTIVTEGQLGHASSRYTLHPAYDGFRQVNALDKMVKIINELKKVRKNFIYERGHFLGDPTISLGKLETVVPGNGSRACLGVERCTLKVDIRFPPGMDKASCKRDIEQIIYNLSIEDPSLKASVSFSPSPMGIESDKPMLPNLSLPLLPALKDAHKEVFGEDLIVDHETNGTTNDRVVDWCRYAGCDLLSFDAIGVPGLNYGAGIVPVCPDERVSIDQLYKHCQVSAVAIASVVGIK